MIKKITLIIISILFVSSCTTTAARNLQSATRSSSEASFAFDAATREFNEAVNNFRTAVFNFDFSIQILENAKTNSEAITARDNAFHAGRIARNALERARHAYENTSQAYDESIRSGVNYQRASQELLMSPDPWENNSSIRNTAIRANNISVDVHNRALSQYEATQRAYLSVFENYNECQRRQLSAVQEHDLATMPDELLVIFAALYEAIDINDYDITFTELFNIFVDALYENE